MYELDMRHLINQTLGVTMNAVNHLHFSVAILTVMCTGVTCRTTGVISLKENVDALHEYMKILASHLANLLTIPPDDPKNVNKSRT